MPRPSTAWSGAGALWITAAGWAAAAERRFGAAWVVTPDAVSTPEQVLGYAAPRRASLPKRRRLGLWAPTPAVTLMKDLRELAARRRFARIEEGPWQEADLALVWQQHDIFGGPGADFARRHGVPFVSFVHAPQVWEARRWGVRRPGWGRLIERWSERPQLCAANLVACVSEEVATEVRRLGVDPARILVTPMSVDPTRFSPSVDGRRIRRRYGLDQCFVFGWTGSFRRFHGLDLAVRAFARMRAEAQEARLLLVGEGPETTAVRRLAEGLGITGSVVLPGAVAHNEVPEYVAAMDAALVIARDGESFHYSPLKLREYMACARPVVVPAVGEMSRTLRDGEDSVHYRPGSAEDLHRAMSVLCRQPALAAEIGRRGRRLVEATGTWDAQLDRLMAAIGALRGRPDTLRP